MAFIIPVKNTTDKFIISYGQFLAILTWDGDSERSSYRAIASIDRDVYRANEGKVAPSGALFVGKSYKSFIQFHKTVTRRDE